MGSKHYSRAEMATRSHGDVKGTLKECTEFVMHKSQQQQFADIQSKIIDYTEHKLRRYALGLKDKQQRNVLAALIVDYCKGDVAIAWRRGLPIYVKVTKE